MCESADSRCTTTATVRGTHLRISGVSGFLCLSFFAAAKKVSAAPHRGNANRPIRNQGKAKKSRSRKGQHRRPPDEQPEKQPPQSHKIKTATRAPTPSPPSPHANPNPPAEQAPTPNPYNVAIPTQEVLHDHQTARAWLHLCIDPPDWLRSQRQGTNRIRQGTRPHRQWPEEGPRDRRIH